MTSTGYRFNFYAMLFVIPLTIILDLIFIPLYGIEGAAIATLIATSCLSLGRGWWIWRMDRMHPFSFQLFLTALLLLAVYGIVASLPISGHPLFSIAIRSLTLLILAAGGAYLLGVSKEANDLVDRVFKR